MKKKRLIIHGAFILAILLVTSIAVYYTFLRPQDCNSDIKCFNSALEKCSKATFIDETEEAFWKYEIITETDKRCRVDVKLISLKKGDIGLQSLEGKSMSCDLPYGLVIKPKEDLGNCHGLLKEELQKAIIDKLHSYIIDNLGEIAEGLESPV